MLKSKNMSQYEKNNKNEIIVELPIKKKKRQKIKTN